jgi:hypothetical protein
MYCFEGDFEECVKSVMRQKDVQVEQHIIHRQGELEAHQNMVRTWIAVQDRFDGFAKVDADTVITQEDLFSNVFADMDLNEASAAQIKLHDYYTDSQINGLNFFTKESKFSIPTDKIYCDRSVQHKKLIHSDHKVFNERLVPAGVHCFYSTGKQAFHFGLHRGIKNRWNEMQLVKDAMIRHNDAPSSIRGYALAGFEVSKTFGNEGFDYNDQQFRAAFKHARKMLGD